MKYIKRPTLFVLFSLIFSFNVFAEELSAVDTEALKNTVNMLNSKQDRENYMKDKKDAQRADGMAKQLLGDEGADKIYAAAAEIMKSITKDSGGDPGSMMQIIEKAQGNPEGFLKNLSPKHQEMIKNLSKEVEARRQPTASPSP